ncbi:MAG: hypothetical protein H3C31_08025 [Brumimicrobium sp.]|nr:hypothetical protein [Brumimicrobium sp.]
MIQKTKYLDNIQTIVGHNGAIYDIIYQDGFLFTSSADKFVAQWDVTTGQQTNFSIKSDFSVYNIDYSPTSNLLVLGNNRGEIHVIDLAKKEEIKLIQHHKSAVFSVKYCSKNNQFYTADKDGVFCAWDGNTLDLLITLPFACGKIREISLNEDESHLVLCGQDGVVRVLETNFFNVVYSFKAHEDGLNCALFDNENLYTGGKDAYIRKWNWRDEKRLLNIPAHNFAVYDLAFLDNKTKIVSVSFDKSIKLWNAEDLSIIEKIEFRQGGHRHVVNRIAKIDENMFATISDDRKIKVWKLR